MKKLKLNFIKKIFSNFTLFLCILFPLFLGYIIGNDINNEFMKLYISKFSVIPIRYSILIFLVFIDYQIFASLNYTSIIFRNKSMLSYFINSIVKSLKYIILFFIMLNTPVFIINSKQFISNLSTILLFILNDIVVLVLLISVIRLIDSKIKKRILSSCLFISTFTILDFILDNYNFYYFDNIAFSFNYIFTLPSVYESYIFILLLLIGLIILMIILSIKFMEKGDYMLNEKSDEEN